jgi:hypothetical protein
MKPIFASAVSLLVGLAVGGYAGYHYQDRRSTSEAVNLMLEGSESSETVQAARATRAIELIESGETQKAVQILSKPIAYYYSLYADHADTEGRRRTCAMIEELVSTNKIVAVEVTNEMSYSDIHHKKQ